MVSKEYFGQLLRVLERLCPLSDGFENALEPLVCSRQFTGPKNILREGEVQQQIWFVVNGLVREVSLSLDTATGRTSWFWYEGDFVFAHPGFFAGLPSLVEIEAYGGTVLLELSRVDLAVLMQDFEEGPLLTETLRYHNQAARAAHIGDLMNLKHAEMVRRFYHGHKAAFLTARAKDIASFLGIKDNGIHRFKKGL
ncbi:Crp/Fnr family transcriptional regulator [Pedobacter sp. SG908]|uniref:Crp/Fnr family transcriptional regulator n=1 Tax=Pedobacter sp. SG908 TaxID=2587135 RepID=UPI00141E1C76|nr:Crp/Fnr family transcriptional regulator [Pedobacter sp. SG908]NII83181.1 CRP-like cAMP-binding protein [Pedobacter sp. SG908]